MSSLIPHFGQTNFLLRLDRYIRPKVSSVFFLCGTKAVGKSRILSVVQEKWVSRGHAVISVDVKSCDGTWSDFVRHFRKGLSQSILRNQQMSDEQGKAQLFKCIKNTFSLAILRELTYFEFLKICFRLCRWRFGFATKGDLEFFAHTWVAELSQSSPFCHLSGFGLFQRGLLLSLHRQLSRPQVDVRQVMRVFDVIDDVNFSGVLCLLHLDSVYPRPLGGSGSAEDRRKFQSLVDHLFAHFQKRKHQFTSTPTVIEGSDKLLLSVSARHLVSDSGSFVFHRLEGLDRSEVFEVFRQRFLPEMEAAEQNRCGACPLYTPDISASDCKNSGVVKGAKFRGNIEVTSCWRTEADSKALTSLQSKAKETEIQDAGVESESFFQNPTPSPHQSASSTATHTFSRWYGDPEVMRMHRRIWKFSRGHPGTLFSLHQLLQDGMTLEEALQHSAEVHLSLLTGLLQDEAEAAEREEKRKQQQLYARGVGGYERGRRLEEEEEEDEMRGQMETETEGTERTEGADACTEVFRRFLSCDSFVLLPDDPRRRTVCALIQKGVLQWDRERAAPVHHPMLLAIRTLVRVQEEGRAAASLLSAEQPMAPPEAAPLTPLWSIAMPPPTAFPSGQMQTETGANALGVSETTRPSAAAQFLQSFSAEGNTVGSVSEKNSSREGAAERDMMKTQDQQGANVKMGNGSKGEKNEAAVSLTETEDPLDESSGGSAVGWGGKETSDLTGPMRFDKASKLDFGLSHSDFLPVRGHRGRAPPGSRPIPSPPESSASEWEVAEAPVQREFQKQRVESARKGKGEKQGAEVPQNPEESRSVRESGWRIV